MEQRKIRNLSDNAKIIKITGQNTGPFDGVDCEHDCYHKDPIRAYYSAPYNGCFQSTIIGYVEYYDAATTDWF